MAVVSELQVIIDGDSSKLLSALTQSATATKVFQSAVGKTAAGAGVAIAGIGVAATAMALDYEESFTRISALSNASAKQIERWKGEVLDLAGETARAPKELADALFFLSSAGLDAAEIMPALEASAQAAAVGLGETEDIANIVASALNAYADSGLEAADVTDTLVAAVREGRAEPEEFANALGRILPIASQAGVSFDQVSASLAGLSNIGLDVNEGVTAMRGALQAIIAPGSQASEALASLGLTAQDLLTVIQEDGLFAALQMLDQAARDNTNTQADYIGVLREVVPNVRALTGVLGLTGQEAAKVEAVFNNVQDATGSTAEALGTLEESAGFKLQQALAKLQATLIEIGDNVLPLVARGAEYVAWALDLMHGKVSSFTPDALNWLGTMLKFSPTLNGAGDVLQETGREMSRLQENTEQLNESQERFRQGMAETKLVRVEEELSGVSEAAERVARAEAEAAAETRRLNAEFRENAIAAMEARSAQLELAGGVLGLIEAARTYTEAQDRVNRLEAAGREGTKAYEDAVTSLLGERMSLEQSVIELGKSLAEEGRSVADAREELRAMGERAGLSRDALKDFINAGLKPVRDEVNGLTDDLNGVPKNVKSHVDVIVNARELYGVVSDIEGYAARHYMIGVEVHTYPGSPWPDEALNTRLIHPLTRMGFKRKGGMWELPLAIGVHTQITREVLAGLQSGAVDNATRHRLHPRGGGAWRPGVAQNDGRGPRLDIHLDRRRFSDELSYDATYRGW